MRVVSIKEPYATLINKKIKYIETRSWNTNYRGEIYIHASKGKYPIKEEISHLITADELNNGYIICKAKLVDSIYIDNDFVQKVKNDDIDNYLCGDYTVGRYAWVLEDVELLDNPIKAKGQLGIWNYNLDSTDNQEIVDAKKIKFGQFNTKLDLWLKPQIIKFINDSQCNIIYDPFAGGGDLLMTLNDRMNYDNLLGLDIDECLGWEINDSLINIPHYDKAIIVTNPPYIAKQSASRKKIDLSKYFSMTDYDDIYLLALDKMLEAQEFVVAIVPESFLNSNYRQKNRLSSITVLEDNPFEDTENPVCVVCFDGKVKDYDEIKIYKNEILVGTLKDIYNIRVKPLNNVKITFNTLDGWLGLRAIDSTDDIKRIGFDFKDNIDYDWENKIKVSSRHLSLIDIDVPKNKRSAFIHECNKLIEDIRKESSDILLTPFKGNTKSGKRRRRLDFKLARAIMEMAYNNIMQD